METHVFVPDMDVHTREHEAKSYRQRLEYELDVINDMGFAGYFMIVADFIQWAKAEGIPVGPGRGSGAGSVVAWSLTITDLDPLRFGLLFERFLNPERVSMPDLDIDFCQDRRDEVIHYVQDKFGQDHVAQIITFGTLQARAALRDVGRVLQMPYGQVDRICKLVPNNPADPMPLVKAIESEPQLAQARAEDVTVARMMDIAIALEGLYRHASTHAAGVVIGDRALDELVPLYRDPRSQTPVTQFSMKYVEIAGLVKFDFLGLKTLTVMARAVEVLRQQDITVDLSTIPFDDAPTYEMLGRAETVGVFQLESSGMRDVLRGLKPDRFEDIIAVVALYRPGPMDNIPSYVNRKHGREPPDYMDNRLEDILSETYGIIIYQEQVMQIAQVLSGYTLGGADLLRRAMGHKIKSEMNAQRKHFVEGAVARGVPESKAKLIFKQVNKFAGYGFNKSHAAAYALVAYQTAYLKANYPVAFLAASMTLDLGNTDKLDLFRQEIGRLGLTLLPPNINKSTSVFSVEFQDDNSQAIRYALAAVRNVGEQAMCELVAEREASGPFHDLVDFARRLDTRLANKRQLEFLVWAGAFDCLEPNRARAYAAVEPMLRFASVAAQARDSSQESLFGGADGLSDQDLVLPQADDWTVTAKLGYEFEALGFFLSSHPLEIYAAYLDSQKVIPCTNIPAHLAEHPGDSHVRLAGIVTSRKERISAKGNRYAFLGLSDAGGAYEVVVFSETLSACRDLLEVGTSLILSAEARVEGENLRLITGRIDALDEAAARGFSAIKVYVDCPAAVASLEGELADKKGGNGAVSVLVRLPANGGGCPREAEIILAGGYTLSPVLCANLASLPGITGVEEV
jgi:DNA polymerase-3 subunit alpha